MTGKQVEAFKNYGSVNVETQILEEVNNTSEFLLPCSRIV